MPHIRPKPLPGGRTDNSFRVSASPHLYWGALRQAQLGQLAGRLRRLVPVRLLAVHAGGADVLRPVAGGLGAPAAPQHGPVPAPEQHGRFDAYGSTRTAGAPGFWTDRSDGLLFLFHLHGFSSLAEYLRDRRSASSDDFWRNHVEDWLDSYARPRLPGWHPYPTSVRLMAWASALSAEGFVDGHLRTRMALLLVRQGRYLRRAVEHDVGGNHVLKNAVGLVFAGAVASDRLYESGMRLLSRQLPSQLLADGGHEERSTSYHREIAHDLEEVASLLDRLGRPEPTWLADARARVADWLHALVGPDGSLPLLNDAWQGPPISDRQDEPLTELRPSGYFVCRHADDMLVFDAGELSPRHLPPHAHADALSVVAWFDGRPLLADPGSFTYTGRTRGSFRATRAHSTVEVDGMDQCEYWGDFRAVGLPTVRCEPVEQDDDVVVLRGSHDGYARLPSPALHHRLVAWLPGDGLVIIDSLEAAEHHAIVSSLVLAPGIQANPNRVGPLEVAALGDGPAAAVEERDYSPWLGQRVTAAAIVDRRRIAPGAPFGWSLLRDGASAVVGKDDVVVTRRDGREFRLPYPRLALSRMRRQSCG